LKEVGVTQSDSPSASDPEPAPHAPKEDAEHYGSILEFIDSIKGSLGELSEYIAYYFSVKLDLAKLTIRRLLLLAALAVMALIAATAVIVVAAVLICVGIAHGLGTLFGSQWVGDVVTGLAVLLAMWAMVRWVIRGMTRFADQHLTAEKYEARRRNQNRRFGRDVSDWEKSGSGDERN
jgi:hypothetical protein